MVREYVRFWKGLLFGVLIVLPFWVLMASFALADHTLISPLNNTNIATIQDRVDLIIQNGGTSSTIYFVNHSNKIIWCTNTTVTPNAVVRCGITIGERQEVKWSVNDTHGGTNEWSGVLNFTSTSDSHAPLITIISDTAPLNLTESTFNFTATCVDCGNGNTTWTNYTRNGVSRKPVLILPFDINETDNNFQDLSGNNNNGSCSGTACPIHNISGAIDGTGFYIGNGWTNKIVIPEPFGNFTSNDNFSISLWLLHNENVLQANNCPFNICASLLSKMNSGSNLGYTIFLSNSSGTLSTKILQFVTGGNTKVTLNIGTNITGGVWYKLDITKSGTLVSAYLNGVLNSSTTVTTINDSSTNFSLFGRSYDTSSFVFFNGSIDSPRILNYALTAQEISEQYNATVQGRNPRVLPEMTELGDNWTVNVCKANITAYECTSKTFFIKANLSILGYDYINESITPSSFIVELNLSDVAYATLYVSTSPTFEVYESFYSTYSDRHDILAHGLLNNTLYYFYINGSDGLFYTTDIKTVTTKQTEEDVSMIQLAIGVILIGLIFWLVYAAKGLNTKTEKNQPILVNTLLQYILYSTAALIAFFLIQIAYIFSIDAVLSVGIQTTIKTIFIFVNTIGIIIFAILGLALIWSVFAWIIGMLKGSGVEARDRQR